MSDLAERLGIAKSTLHHVLAALTAGGWVERDPASLEVTLGLRAWEVGQAYVRAQTLSQRAQPFMDAVRDDLGETVRLAVLSAQDNVCIAKSQGTHPLVFDQRVGARLPAHATGLGKALLAGLTPSEVDVLYRDYAFEPFTEHTITDLDALQQELQLIRARGWASDDGEFILGVNCIALPVRSRDGDVVAALSVSVPSARFTEGHQARTHELLATAARSLSDRLGRDVDLS